MNHLESMIKLVWNMNCVHLFFISPKTSAAMIRFQQKKERIELEIHFGDCILMLCEMGCTLCKSGCYPVAFGFLCETKKPYTKTLHSY